MDRRALKICIADRNPHVRGLLRREFAAQGYEVLVAKNSSEVIKTCESQNPPDLLVLDTELPCADKEPLLSRLEALMPALPIVLYAFAEDALNHPAAAKAAAVIEKSGNTDQLRTAVGRIMESRDRKTRDKQPT